MASASPNLAERYSGGRVIRFITVAVVVGGLGYLAGRDANMALLAAVAIGAVGLIAFDPLIFPVLTFPAMLLLSRTGSGGGLSLSDLVLFVGTLCALLQLRTDESPELRSLLWIVAFYQACLIPVLVYNPYQANVVEWIHETFLVGGSLVVGYVVARAGRARTGMSLYLLGCVFLSGWACLHAITTHFQPVYLPTFQKNALGDLLSLGAIVAYARPAWLGWSPRASNGAVVVLAVGILAAQSKQAMIGLAVGVLLVLLRSRGIGRRSRIVLLSMIPLIVIAYVVTANQLASGNKFNAAHQRLQWYSDSLTIWESSKWLGVGLRWWYTTRFSVQFQPPNAEFEMLTSGGVVGLAAFLIAAFAALWLLWRVDPRYGVLAVAVISARLVQGQLDLFWVASQSSLPWLIVGAALGAQSRDRAVPLADSPERAKVDLHS